MRFTYDELGRKKTESYFDSGQNAAGYKTAEFFYDDASVPYSKGRLTSINTYATPLRVATDTTTNSISGYDALGRVTGSSLSIGGFVYPFAYKYNLTDSLIEQKYPSGRAVQTCYDGANRVSQVGGSCATLGLPAYVTQAKYAPHGGSASYVYGNLLFRENSYNSRLQLAGYVDSVASGSAGNYTGNAAHQMLAATLDWGTVQNNGNLKSATYNNGGHAYPTFLTFRQDYDYDVLNRLSTATDSGGWNRTFDYGVFGNMTATGNPSPPSVTYNANNQISNLVNPPAGYPRGYDQAGNQMMVNGNYPSYDHENRMISVRDGQSPGQVMTYVYDCLGQRVAKYGTSGPKTVFVYDAFGQLAVEYSTAAPTAPACGTCYLSADHLGTARLVTSTNLVSAADGNGVAVARHDYLPFGEEVGARFGRNSEWGDGVDGVRQKFTGKERDIETGLDYFGAKVLRECAGEVYESGLEFLSATGALCEP